MIKKTKIGRDLFNNGIMTEFIIKIGDFGQCEFDFGETRSMNPDIPREPKYFKKWGIYPNEFSGYDFQYLLATLTPILNNKYGLSYYYIHTMLLDFIQPVKFTTAQDRPLQITDKTPRDILIFLKQVVLKTLH
jgi:hypothetical protein